MKIKTTNKPVTSVNQHNLTATVVFQWDTFQIAIKEDTSNYSNNKVVLTSVLGGEIQNWMRPTLAFSTLFGPPAPEVLEVNTRPSINSVSSTVPLEMKLSSRNAECEIIYT